MTSTRWEYQVLQWFRRWTGSEWEGSAQLVRGTETTVVWQGRGDEWTLGPRNADLMNSYGEEGWELVGPPMASYAVVNDQGLDVSAWTSVVFWMKRPAELPVE